MTAALSPTMAKRLAAQARAFDRAAAMHDRMLQLAPAVDRMARALESAGPALDRAAAVVEAMERRGHVIAFVGPGSMLPVPPAATLAAFNAALRTFDSFPEPHPALDPKNAIRGDRK